MNSAFAHLLTPEDRADALRRLHRALRVEGVLFLDLPNFLWILKHYRQPEAQVREQGNHQVRLLRHHEIDCDRATFTTIEEYVYRRRAERGGGEGVEAARVRDDGAA